MIHQAEDQAIRNIQRYLRQLSYDDPQIASPPVDGIFDDVTKNSLISFQRAFGLEPNGIADKMTFDRLYSEYLRSLTRYAPPDSPSLFPRTPTDYEVSAEDEFFLVNVIQFLLNEISIIYDGLGEIAISGKYDTATENAVKEFQRMSGLYDSGKVDKMTWDRLVRAYNNYAYDYVR